jgi:Bacterial dipeptidyl-peptidase Sh3 domain
MDNLIDGQSSANRPLFQFGEPDTVTPNAIPSHQLALSGPSEKLDAPHWPVRGDLAHVRLAGRVFVPHYAVPMEHYVIEAGATLRVAGREDAELREVLAGGTLFNVLDMAGGWAWGQVGEDGFVGYLPLEALQERRS